MERELEKDLLKRKESPFRKPLIIQGARQVGKTYLMKEFGRKYYKKTYYIDFEVDKEIKDIFEKTIKVDEIIDLIGIYFKKKINPVNSLIIFDEIQECPKALTALKYFYEYKKEYHIISAGSLLGISFHPNISFPVGKVDLLNLYPFSFKEYLLATDSSNLLELLTTENIDKIPYFKDQFIQKLKEYYVVGGMPEVITAFKRTKSFKSVRKKQENIVELYKYDFSKHSDNTLKTRLNLTYNSLAGQLSKENKKFFFGGIKEGARAKEFELALERLENTGLIHKAYNVSKPNIPLSSYQEFSSFKVFLSDIGLLGALAKLDPKVILNGNSLFNEFKGALTEQYVILELIKTFGKNIYYYSEARSQLEIDFMIEYEGLIIPIEVKAETNLMAKSLKSYKNKFNPTLSIRTSMSDYKDEGWLINVPLYMISLLNEIILSKLENSNN